MGEFGVEQLELRGSPRWGQISLDSFNFLTLNPKSNKRHKITSLKMKLKLLISKTLGRHLLAMKPLKTVILIMVLLIIESNFIGHIGATHRLANINRNHHSTLEANNPGATRESGSQFRVQSPVLTTTTTATTTTMTTGGRQDFHHLYGFLDRSTELKMDEFMRWLVDELVQMGATQSQNMTTKDKVIRRVHRNKRSNNQLTNQGNHSNSLPPDVEMISQAKGSKLIKSYNPSGINVTHMAMRAGLDARALRKPRRQPVLSSAAGLSDDPGDEIEVTSPSPAEVLFEDPSPIEGISEPNSQGRGNGNFDEASHDSNKEAESSNENNIDHQVDDTMNEIMPQEISRPRGKSRRKSQNLILDPGPLTSPSLAQSNSMDPTNSMMLTKKRVPPPEQNPFKTNRNPSLAELVDEDRPQTNDGVVPQVGDQSILEHNGISNLNNGNRRVLNVSQEEQLVRDQIRLGNLIKDYEQELANRAAVSRRTKRPFNVNNNLYDSDNLDPVDDPRLTHLANIAQYPRTRAPYVVTGGNSDSLTTYQPEAANHITRELNNFTLPRRSQINLFPQQAIQSAGSMVGHPPMLPNRVAQASMHPFTKQRQDYTHHLEENFYNVHFPDQVPLGNQRKVPLHTIEQPLIAQQIQTPTSSPPQVVNDKNHTSPSVSSTLRPTSSKLKASDSRRTSNFANPSSRFLYNQQQLMEAQHHDGYTLMPMVPNIVSNSNNGVLGILKASSTPAYQGLLAGSPASAASGLVANHQMIGHQVQPMRRTAALWTNPSAALPYSTMPSLPTAAYIIPSSTLPYNGYGGFNGQPLSSMKNQHQGGQQLATKRHMMGSSSSQHNYRVGAGRYNAQMGYDDSGGSPEASPATSDPLWSSSQQQQQSQEDDYQQAPQTIQITAVPNGLGAINGVNGWGGGFGGGWNGWGGNPWNGRQVLLVNRQPQVGSEWRQWALPIAVILALPLILGAIFVPVFLKSVMFLIQILQMLGLLMPPAQLAGHLAASAHNASSG